MTKRYDGNHSYFWEMQESSGTTVAAIVGLYGTASAGLAITSNYEGGYSRHFIAEDTSGIAIDSKILPPGAKTIRFRIKFTGTPVVGDYGYIISTDNNTNGLIIYTDSDRKLTFQVRFSTGNAYVVSNLAFEVGETYDVQFTLSGVYTKCYIKQLTGTNAGKWLDSSNNPQTTIVENAGNSNGVGTELESVLTTGYIGRYYETYGLFELRYLRLVDLYDFQISTIARTDMLDTYTYDLDTNLVAHHPFHGNLTDISGNSHAISYDVTPVYDVENKRMKSDKDVYYKTRMDNTIFKSSAWTLSFWSSQEDFIGTHDRTILTNLVGTLDGLHIVNYYGSGTIVITSQTFISLGEHSPTQSHFVMVFDGYYIHVFRDGLKIAKLPYICLTETLMYILCDPLGIDWNTNGTISEMRIYDRKITGYTGEISSYGTDEIDEIFALGEYVAEDKVETPTALPVAGTYTAIQNVVLSCTTSGSEIKYGFAIDDINTTYTTAIEISETKTIYAQATKSGWDDSDIMTSVYIINIPVPVPETQYYYNPIKSDLVNTYSGCSRITSIGENKVTGISKIYSMLISIPEDITINEGSIIGKVKENTPIYNSVGNFAGRAKGKDTVEDKNFDIGFGLDYVYSSDNVKFNEVSKNTLLATLCGESFQDTNTIKLIGTNGCKKVQVVLPDTDAQYVLYRDTMLILPGSDDGTGKPILKINKVLPAYDDVITSMFEMIHMSPTKKIQGIRASCVSFTNAQFTENNDVNKISMQGTRICDIRHLDKYFIDGLTVPDMVFTGTKTLYDIDAKVLIHPTIGTTTTTTNVINKTSHYFTYGSTIFILSTGGETLLTNYTIYYVKDVNTTSFTISESLGGAVIALDGSKTVTFSKIPQLEDLDIVFIHDSDKLRGFIYDSSVTLVEFGSTLTLGKGCKIFSKTMINECTMTTQNIYMFVKEAGISNLAVATPIKSILSGSGTETYIWELRDFNFLNGDWENYIS